MDLASEPGPPGPSLGLDGARRARSPVARLMRPRSVAIVGASATPGSLGAGVLANLERFGFSGDIHLVNPKRAEIGGRPCVPTAEELPRGVDCAVLAIPAEGVADTVAACARRGVGGLVVFSAGFAETGPEGRARQDDMARLAAAHGMAMEGPNCLGMVNFVDGVPLTFSVTHPAPPKAPGVAILSQSGAMAVVMRAALDARDLSVTFAISTGNEALNGVEDFLAELIDDAATGVITLVVEQFRAPGRVLALLRDARARGRPVVLLHPGRSAAARTAAETHTGALTGDWTVMRTLVTHAGCVVVDTLEELIDVAEMLLRCPGVPAAGPAVLTDSGAFKGQVLDYADTLSLPLPQPSAATEGRLAAVLPAFALPSNPLDLTAQAVVDLGLYRATMAPFLEDDAFGSLVLTVILTSEATARRKLPPIIDALRDLAPRKPVVFAMLGEDTTVPPELVGALRALGVPFLRSPERALRALAVLTAFARRPLAATPAQSQDGGASPLPCGTIPEHEAKRVLAGIGISVPDSALARDLSAALEAAGRIGYPVVLKAQSADLSHKSDAGGVVLGLSDEKALRDGWDRLHRAVAAARPGLVLDGVLVEAMGCPGVELILGARRDPAWGAVVLAGLGGIWAETLGDVRVLPPDLPHEAVRAELLRLKGAALLRGGRGTPAPDVDAAAAAVVALGALVQARPEIREVDINPLVLRPDGAVALDALIVTG